MTHYKDNHIGKSGAGLKGADKQQGRLVDQGGGTYGDGEKTAPKRLRRENEKEDEFQETPKN